MALDGINDACEVQLQDTLEDKRNEVNSLAEQVVEAKEQLRCVSRQLLDTQARLETMNDLTFALYSSQLAVDCLTAQLLDVKEELLNTLKDKRSAVNSLTPQLLDAKAQIAAKDAYIAKLESKCGIVPDDPWAQRFLSMSPDAPEWTVPSGFYDPTTSEEVMTAVEKPLEHSTILDNDWHTCFDEASSSVRPMLAPPTSLPPPAPPPQSINCHIFFI